MSHPIKLFLCMQSQPSQPCHTSQTTNCRFTCRIAPKKCTTLRLVGGLHVCVPHLLMTILSLSRRKYAIISDCRAAVYNLQFYTWSFWPVAFYGCADTPNTHTYIYIQTHSSVMLDLWYPFWNSTTGGNGCCLHGTIMQLNRFT